MGNDGKRRWPPTGFGWGWLVLIVGAMVAGGTIVLFYTAYAGAGCRGSDTGWGSNRAFFCRDVMGDFVASSLPWVVLIAVSVAIIAGLVGGTMTVLIHGGQMRGAWLASTGLAYALFNAGTIWVPNAGSIDADLALSVLPLTALIATGLLAVWVAITGGLGAIVIMARARPSSYGARCRRDARPLVRAIGRGSSARSGS